MFGTVMTLLGVFGYLYFVEKIAKKSKSTALVLSFLSCLVIVLVFQNELVYTPVIPLVSKSSEDNPKGFRHPTEVNLTTLDIEVTTEDGLKLRGWLISKPTNKQIIVYFH